MSNLEGDSATRSPLDRGNITENDSSSAQLHLGETVVQSLKDVYFTRKNTLLEGTLTLTNFQLVFEQGDETILSIHLHSVLSVELQSEKTSGSYLSSIFSLGMTSEETGKEVLSITSKASWTWAFSVPTSNVLLTKSLRELTAKLREALDRHHNESFDSLQKTGFKSPRSPEGAMSSSDDASQSEESDILSQDQSQGSNASASLFDGWSVYSEKNEFGFLGIPDKFFRLCTINQNFELCSSYPPVLVVPSFIPDSVVIKSAHFRSKQRFPALSWRYPTNGAIIIRCSQPNAGMTQKRSPDDERLIRAFHKTAQDRAAELNLPKPALIIVDARPRVNAMGNHVAGYGTETPANYGANLTFLGLENIHQVQASLTKLQTLCFTPADHSTWLSCLHETQWLKLIGDILTSSIRVASLVADEGASILLHCSDGWDRTPQVGSLVQLLLEPKYRKLEGFISLIEKEWIGFGHQFETRCGREHAKRSPVFMQWIECVWQVMQQYPRSFQFNEAFLIKTIDAAYSGQFGTFMADNVRDRKAQELHKNTTSFWTVVLTRRHQMLNPFFAETGPTRLEPSVARSLRFWAALHCRGDRDSQALQSLEEGYAELADFQTSLIARHSYLAAKTERLDGIIQALADNPHTAAAVAELLERTPEVVNLDSVEPIAGVAQTPPRKAGEVHLPIHTQIALASSASVDPNVAATSIPSLAAEEITKAPPIPSVTLTDHDTDDSPDIFTPESDNSPAYIQDHQHVAKNFHSLQFLRSARDKMTGKFQKYGRSSQLDEKAQAPPVWVADSQVRECHRCHRAFSATRRKHHCRSCGHVFCGKCSDYFTPIPRFGFRDSVRTCAPCYANLLHERSPNRVAMTPPRQPNKVDERSASCPPLQSPPMKPIDTAASVVFDVEGLLAPPTGNSGRLRTKSLVGEHEGTLLVHLDE